MIIPESGGCLHQGPRLPAPLGLGVEQVANLSMQAATLSYRRRGTPATRLHTVSQGQDCLDFAPTHDGRTPGVFPLPRIGNVTRFLLLSCSNAASASRFTLGGSFVGPLPAKSAEVNVAVSSAHLAYAQQQRGGPHAD